nr:hypothetical protein [Tanacetum cinerariifolium]
VKDPLSKDLTSGIRAIWRTLLKKTTFLHTQLTLSVSMDSLSPQNELKARGTLLMVLPDKHQLNFNSHKHAKTLMEDIEKRFGYKSLLVSQLEIHGVSLSQEDVNLKFLRSLPSEWMTHTLIWRNKANLEEQSLNDLFNSLKIYETKVKPSSFTSTASQNLAFMSSSHTNSTTDSVGVVASVFVACAKLSASPLPNVDSLSNAVIYSFFASQSTSPQLDNEDLKQIDVDDLEEMDLRWQMAMLTMRARRFLQKTGRNLGANGPTSIGFDMTKVECYNCHMTDHFSRECRSSKDPRRSGSYDWSYQAEEEPANFALMAFSSSSSDNEVPSCSKACSKAYAQLHTQYDKLTNDFSKSQFDVISYQTGLESVEARLLVYKQNESVFEENIKLFNIEVQLRDIALATLRQKLDKAEKDRDDLKLKFQPNGGYHVVPPPYTGTFMPPKPDLVFNTAPTVVETDHLAFNQIETTILAATPVPASPKSNSSGQRRNRKACFVCKSYAPLTHSKPPKHMIPTVVLTQYKQVSNTAVRPVSAALPNIIVTRPRHAHHVVTKLKSPIRRHITRSPSSKTSNLPPRVTAVQASVVSVTQGTQETWVWRPKCPILDHDFRTTSASMTLKRFHFNDALGRSKSVMAWVPKRI